MALGGSVCSVVDCKNTYSRSRGEGISFFRQVYTQPNYNVLERMNTRLNNANHGYILSWVTSYSFPKNLSIQKEWIRRCGNQQSIDPEFSRICSAHFKEEDYVRDLQFELMGLVAYSTLNM